MTSSFETLPPELFRFILAYLSPEDVSSLAQTCHQMNIITRDEKIWRQYFFQRYLHILRMLQNNTKQNIERINFFIQVYIFHSFISIFQ